MMDSTRGHSEKANSPDSSEVNSSSASIVSKGLKITSKSDLPQNAQVVKKLAQLSLSEGGRQEIQKIIDKRDKSKETKIGSYEDFCGKFLSVLNKKKISPPPDLQSTLDRSMEIDKVREKWADDFANVFAYVRGCMTEEKAEKLIHNNDEIKKKFKKYNTRAKQQDGHQFYVNSSLGKKNTCKAIIDMSEGSINVLYCERAKDSSTLQLSDHLGELWQYVSSKIKNGIDDYKNKTKMDSSQVDECSLKKLTHSNITNEETKNTIILLLQEELKALKSKGFGKEEPINIYRDSNEEKIVGIIGTPNGNATAFLPHSYDFAFGCETVTRIEVNLKLLSWDIPIDKIKHTDIQIDEINFYFD